MSGIKSIARKVFEKAGYDVMPYPAKDWMFFRHVMEATLTGLNINCILDVGANGGRFGAQLREIGYKGWLISFEPVPAVYQKLKEAAAGDERWRTFDWALGEEEGEAEINVYSETEFCSFRPVTAFARERYTEMTELVSKVRVPVKRLDQVLDLCIQGLADPRLYLKIDTQGFDLQVLNGSAGVLDRMLGAQTELVFKHVYEGSPGYLESLKAFSDKGFDVVDFIPITRGSDGLSAVEMDCVMRRRTQ
jgi:FkbM family methyltransferase